MFNKKPKEIELMNEGLIPSILSHQEMLKMGATGALSRAFERYILLDKIEGLDPEPSTWGDGYEFKKGEEIKSSIEVIYDKDRDIYFLQNGNHRIKQARVNGDKYIRAFIQPDNGRIGSDAKLNVSLNDKIELIKENNLDYTTTDDKNNVLIYVDGNKILNKLKTDSPEFDITNKDNQIGDRVEKAKEFISNYKTDKRPIHPTTGERIEYLGKHSFEPSVASFDMNGKLGFTDGRHRILAAIESGINKVGVLVPKNQVDMFKDLINESLTTNGVVYHGTDNKFTVFNDSKPIFFVDNINVAKTYGDNVIKAKLSMHNPIELDFNGKSTYYFYNKWYLPSELANKIKEISDDIKNRYSLDDDLKEYLEELDFSDIYGNLDGIIMKNINDAMDGVFSTHELANNYVVFNKEQIHIINEQQPLNESNSQLEDTFIKINSPNIKSHVDSLINKYGDKAEVMNYIKHGDEESDKPEYSISYTYCKKLISLATNLKDKHGLDKDKFELYGGFPLINYLSKELNNKRDIISRSKKTKTMAGFNHQYNKEHERVGLIKNGKKYVDRNLRECIELIKESEVKVNKEASCIVLLNEDKKILLLKRSDKTPWQPGKWSLVGGKIDLGENAKQAGIRECGEETGLGIKGNKLIYCFTMKEDDYEVNFFIGVSEGSDVRLNGEHTEFKWVTPNEIPELETVPNLLGEIKKCFKTLDENKEETDINENTSNIDNKTQDQLYKLFQKLNKQYVKLDKELDNTKDTIESEKISEKLEEIQELMSKISAKMENESINEDVINEKLTNVDEDVDMLYNKYFKINIDEIQRTGIITNDMFKELETSTKTLKSEESIKGNEINPCRIIINKFSTGTNNYYDPNNKLISLSINWSATKYCLNDYNGDIKKAALDLPSDQYGSFLKEFTEERIKGTIHHELAHWLDDTFNNQNIKKRITKQVKLNTRDLNGIPVNASKMELQGQIHNIKQLYNKYRDKWDSWTLNDVFKNIPSLILVAKSLQSKPEIRKQWLRDLITRMNREGLLGKNMHLNNNLKEETVINEDFNKTEYLKWKRNNVTYRGIKSFGQENNVYGSFGKGLYTVPASNKVMAKTFGKLYFVVNGIPKNPKVVNSLNDAEMFRYNLINEYCKQHNNVKSDGFFDNNTSMETEMLKLGYDGFVIKGREMVNYKPENDKVKYFSNENQLIQYYENFIENNNSVIN